MASSVILGAARTAFGRLGGALASLDATDLGGYAVQGAVARAGIDPTDVDHVILGQVLQAGQGQIPSRQAQIKGGIPRETPSETVNKVCASGMRAIGIADTSIRAGDGAVIVAGGMESMSGAPHLLRGVRFGLRLGDTATVDAISQDGLTSPFTGLRMITEADGVARELGIGRHDMDRFAARSHRRAATAAAEGKFDSEIVCVLAGARREPVEADETIRPDTNPAALARLSAIGGPAATHTAGNSPGVNDGACALVLASTQWAERRERQPLAHILSYGSVAGDFASLAFTPARAAAKALARIGKSPSDVDLWEINEAFASVVLNSVRVLELDQQKVNVNGGAIALGHPIGASGARIVGTLVHELRRRGGGLGCAAICSGGGQGDAVVVRVN